MKKLQKKDMKNVQGGLQGSLQTCYAKCETKLAQCINITHNTYGCTQNYNACAIECNITWGG